MKLLIIGGTGFTGKRVLALFRNQTEQVDVLVRSEGKADEVRNLGFNPVFGDLESGERLEKVFSNDYSGLIFIASMGFGHADLVVSLAERFKVNRCVFVSTTGIFTHLSAPSKTVRIAAEERIKKSSLDWTIIRPTMIYGGLDDRNMVRLLKAIKKYPLLPIPGSGKALMQPVFVSDLAQAIHDAFFSNLAVKKAFNVSGDKPRSFNEIVGICCAQLGCRRLIIHIPISLVRIFVRLLEKTPFKWVKEEQVIRLCEDKAFSHQDAKDSFQYAPIAFQEGIKHLVDELAQS